MDTKKAILKTYAKELSLDIFRIGCDQKNFLILKMALTKPISVMDIKKHLNLTSMPANRRINQLVEVGLLKREYKKTRIISTKLAQMFINIISHIQDVIKNEIDINQRIVFK